jgi:uncharacterized protein (TIGR03089 family)
VPTATIADVLQVLRAEPGRPRLTWYGDAGERVELSGAVLENWVNKTTNLLVEEFDARPGAVIQLDLPPHWRTIVWAFAVWRSAACVSMTATSPADLVLTDSPVRHVGADPLVVVSLPALARHYDGELPRGAVDAASAVMTYADVLGWVEATDPHARALDDGEAPITFADLLAGGHAHAGGARVLHTVGDGRTDDVVRLLRTALAVLAGNGSIVLIAPTVATELAADPGRRVRLVESERITDEA